MSASRSVLVTDHGYSQSRTTLVTVRALAAAGYRPVVTRTSPWCLAAVSRHCEGRLRIPSGGGAAYEEAIRRELATHEYLTVLPTSDLALLALDERAARILDKRSLAAAAAIVGIASPPTREFSGLSELADAASELRYPVVVKPALSRFRPYRVDRPDELRLGRSIDGTLLVQPFITDRLRAVSGVMWSGRLVAVVHQRYVRTWPPDCGGASVAETVAPDFALEEQLEALLTDHRGVFMAQFAGSALLDLNPRPYGSLPLAVAAGANLPALYCDLLRELAPPERPVRARPGVRYRWLEGDLRSLTRGVRRGSVSSLSALRELARRADRGATVDTWRDPSPTLVRAAYAVGQRRWSDRASSGLDR